ncbi:MAG: HD domain-containing protein [Candidatus Aminicenantes bacterium]|nr:HD domain-containing protein [Candidatus Aminicenantes bacterium]
MPTKLKVLILEDCAADAELALHELRRAGYEPEWKRVETEPDFLAQFDQGWDIMLLDYNLPEIDGLRALEIMRERGLDIPVIIVSGTIGEEKAVAAMKAGANDYVMKDRLARLGQAVERALRDAVERRDRKRAEEALHQADKNFRRSLDESPLGIRIVSVDGKVLYANRAILDIYGYDDIEELRSTPAKKRYTAASYAEFQSRRKKRMNGEDYASEYEISIIRKTGQIRRLRVFRKEISWNGQKQFQTIYQDITRQKKTEEKLGKTLSSLRNALGGIIQVLSATTEKRDPYTAGHQKRVADLARAIGQEMGLAADRVEGLRIAGVIHDIGKVSIPAEFLSKPSRLTEIEYGMIKSHVQVGYDILQNIDFSWPLAEMVLQHHERMNGSGYPQGLIGENTLLEARILAVSDVVEAMASHRPYRPALGIAAALEEIAKNKGILYDPDVVSTCLTLFREKNFEFKP